MKTTKKLIPVVVFPIFAIFAIFSIFALLSSCAKEDINPTSPDPGTTSSSTDISSASGFDAAITTGNGAPSGTHYTLNIIGVPRGKSANMTTGGRIFVSLAGTTKIMLKEGSTFSVIDANGTDGTASFQLPNPDPTNSGTTTYSVYARATAGSGTASMTTCATDPTTGAVICSNSTYVAVKSTRFANVSRDLLYIYADIDGDGVTERYPLFDSRLENYFWNYDNDGLKVLQLRFYMISTTVQ